ncbi:MAG: hypothetical protein ACLQAH_12730 [Limisphaerales bacterium]
MKHHPGNIFWLVFTGLVAAGLLFILMPPRPDNAGLKTVADARQSLRDQGFKTDLADFDFSTSPELRAREAILKNTASNRFSGSSPEHPNLLPPVGNNSAMVIGKLDSLNRQNHSSSDDSVRLSWGEFRDAVNRNQSLYDPACQAILSGPIRFNLNISRGNNMLLPHLAVMKNLAQTFGERTVLALHDDDQSAAWTNLLAATRLVTAWNTEPMEISHLVRFGDAAIAFNATWQALQSRNWPDDQLARLQAEWESVDYFTNLPETAAFTRASSVAACEFDRRRSIRDDYTYMEFCMVAIHFPPVIFSELTREWKQRAYSQNGSYEDEKNLIFFYRDREVEIRNAIQAATWAQMRQLPGVSNQIIFQSPHSSRLQALMRLRRAGLGRENQGSILLRRAAEAEAQRRVLITALALERYRGKHGFFPNSLAELTPEFLKTPLPGFMDGQPLRYRLAADGHFLLYSVGLDGVDNGGKMRRSWRETGLDRPPRPGTPEAEFDLVWPMPNGNAALQEEQQIQTEAEKTKARVEELRKKEYLKEISDREWKLSLARQSRVAKILAADWSVVNSKPTFNGQSVEQYVGNPNASGTNQLSLDALLTPKQILPGREPEDITFEFPISYNVITNNNMLRLIVDGDPEEEFKMDSGGVVYVCERATNGDCLVIWHAIYDPPGAHAVQAYLVLNNPRGETLYMWGRPIAVTTSNLCQFSLDCVNYDVNAGARFHARLPERNGNFSIECVTTNGAHLTTLTGSTTNGEFNVVWNLVDDHGHRLNGETFNSIVHITLPDSGRSQTLRGP